LLYPLASKAGSSAIAITSTGTIAHNINHNIGLRPFGRAKMAPTIPANAARIIYLITGVL